MYENDYLYAVERDGAYLAHYGVKGMKWGVRKAIERGNDRALGRQYRKAAKKLAKLEKRAASGKKYAKRAARLGAGAAVAGGLAALGTSGVGKIVNAAGAGTRSAMKGFGGVAAGVGRAATNAAMRIPGNGRLKKAALNSSLAVRNVGIASQNAAGRTGVAVSKAGDAIQRWGHSKSIGSSANKAISTGLTNFQRGGSKAAQTLTSNGMIRQARIGSRNLGNLSNSTIARLGAGAIGAGLAGAAGYNAYRAATTKRAAKKAAQFRSEMNKAFAGTKYANGGGNRQGGRRRKRR